MKKLSTFIFILTTSFCLFSQIKTEYTRFWSFENKLAKVEKNGKIGFINTEFEEVIPCQFSWVNDFPNNSNVASFSDSTKLFGFIDKSGKILTQPKYSMVFYPDEETKLRYVSIGDSLFGFVNENGEELIPCLYQQTESTPEYFHDGIVRLKKNGKYGIIDFKGRILVNFEYDYFIGFDWEKGFPKDYLCAKKDGKCFYINMRNFDIIPSEYEYAEEFKDGLSLIKKNSKYGFVNRNFEEVIPCVFDYARSFREKRTIVSDSSRKFGVINEKGELIVKCIYNEIGNFENGIAQVTLYGDSIVNEEIPENDEMINYISGGSYEDLISGVEIKHYREVRYGDQSGYIDKNGTVVIPIKYDKAHYKDEDYIYPHVSLCRDSSCVLANNTGKIITQKNYTQIGFFDRFYLNVDVILREKDNYCLGKRNNLIYSLNKKGKEINKIGSQYLIYFYNGLALIKDSNNKCGFINPKGKTVIPFEYDYCDYNQFIDGFSIIKKGENYGMINKKNQVIIPFEYDDLEHFSNGFAYARKGKTYFFLNKRGEQVLVSTP